MPERTGGARLTMCLTAIVKSILFALCEGGLVSPSVVIIATVRGNFMPYIVESNIKI